MIDWKLAPEGAVAVAVNPHDHEIAWVRESGGYTGWSLNEWDTNINDEWKTIATRPTQTKTVADAVEAFDGKWPNSRYDMAWWDSDTEQVLLGCNPTSDTICTRAEFEAYVKEQEGEKWTHEYDNSNPRRLKIICDKPDVNGEIAVIVNGPKGAFYTKTLPSKIRLIKPTLSKAEAWDKLKNLPANEWSIHSHVMELENKYDII